MFIIILLWSILFQCNTIFVNFLGNSKRAEYYFFFSSAYIPMYIHEWKLTNHKRNSGHNCLLLYFLPLKFLKNNFIFSLNVITNKQETIFLYAIPICEKLQPCPWRHHSSSLYLGSQLPKLLPQIHKNHMWPLSW